MTFEQVMKSRNGSWENGFAVVMDPQGYFWRIAEGSPENYTLRREARHFGLESDAPRPAAKAAKAKRTVGLPLEESPSADTIESLEL